MANVEVLVLITRIQPMEHLQLTSMLDKAKRHAAIRNLDSPIAASLRGSNIASSPGNPSFISPIDIQKDTCIANLNSIGISLVVLAKRLMSPIMHLKESRWIGLPFSQI